MKGGTILDESNLERVDAIEALIKSTPAGPNEEALGKVLENCAALRTLADKPSGWGHEIRSVLDSLEANARFYFSSGPARWALRPWKDGRGIPGPDYVRGLTFEECSRIRSAFARLAEYGEHSGGSHEEKRTTVPTDRDGNPIDLREVLRLHYRWRQTAGRVGARADLRGADLRGVAFCRVDLTGIDLRDTNLQGCDFHGARFTGVDLSGCDFLGCYMPHANFRGANLSNAKNIVSLGTYGLRGRMVMVRWEDGPRITAGLHHQFFTVEEARQYWGRSPGPGSGSNPEQTIRERKGLYLLRRQAVEDLLRLAHARGWPGCEPLPTGPEIGPRGPGRAESPNLPRG